jgi:Amt family ammonium transporter
MNKVTNILSKLRSGKFGLAAVSLVILATAPATATADVSVETAYILNTLSFLMHGFLVLWMAAGFAMLEAGLVRTKSVTTILLKNIALFSISGIAFYAVGYNLMYEGVDGGFIGSLAVWNADDTAAMNGDYSAGYASSSDWFFQMVFVATAASIVSGALAERIKLWPFLVFVVVLTAFVYPIQGAWHWGGGWLSELGFVDFAGSTLVHSVGGWAALTGAIILGPRNGRFGDDGTVKPLPGSSLPLATLGTFILWFGWLGFNGGSQLALGSAADAIAISNIYVNTTMASAGGVVSAMLLSQLLKGRVDLVMALNGALAGLVSVTASPDTPTIGAACLIGAVGGAIVILGTPLLDRFKIDDVVGAVPVHLFAGVWGTLAVPLTNPDASIIAQVTGIVCIGLFVAVVSAVAWFSLRTSVGLRLTEVGEALGIDKVETGMRAYPEFETTTAGVA